MRFADDFVVSFQYRHDANQFQQKVREWFAEFGLELAEEKTRCMLFGRFAAVTRLRHELGRPETFEFLGFQHVCGIDRAGRFALMRIPSAKSCRKFLTRTREWILQHRHWRRWEQQQHLTRRLRGFYHYFGLHHCERKLQWVRQQVQRQWISALNRRGQRRRTNWTRLKDQPWFKLPYAQNLHPTVSMMQTSAKVTWGARCGESARRGLLGETSSRGHAYSVRRRRENVFRREAPHRLTSSRLVSTIPFDLWVQHWRQHRATGEVIVVRYADDAVLGFQHRADAEQILRDWKERLSRFGLELHPDKTRLIEFGRYAGANRKERGAGKPETFNFLGFTQICGKTWKAGKFHLLRKTIRQRLSAKLRALKEELRRRKHLSVAELGKWVGTECWGY